MNLGANLGRRNTLRKSMQSGAGSGNGSSSPRLSAVDYMTSLAAKVGELYISYDLTYLLSIKRDLDLRRGGSGEQHAASAAAAAAAVAAALAAQAQSQQATNTVHHAQSFMSSDTSLSNGDLVTSSDGLIVSCSVSKFMFHTKTSASAAAQVGNGILRLLILKSL
jgi:hypothetical protein